MRAWRFMMPQSQQMSKLGKSESFVGLREFVLTKKTNHDSMKQTSVTDFTHPLSPPEPWTKSGLQDCIEKFILETDQVISPTFSLLSAQLTKNRLSLLLIAPLSGSFYFIKRRGMKSEPQIKMFAIEQRSWMVSRSVVLAHGWPFGKRSK